MAEMFDIGLALLRIVPRVNWC